MLIYDIYIDILKYIIHIYEMNAEGCWYFSNLYSSEVHLP